MNENAIREYFEAASLKRPAFGHYDCVRFVIELLYVGFDRDYRASMEYWDRRSAVRRLRKSGGLRNAFTDCFGEELSSDDLVVGDISFYPKPDTVGLILPNCVAAYYCGAVQALDRSTVTIGWRT
jgi:hypothetical protein